ncbi:SixA phosphatase family protein [Bizionia sp. KMM 8389]
MKKLTIVRHAKSSWKLKLPDYQRPLSLRGENDANLVSKHVKETNFSPDLVISSPATRAQTTAEIFIKNLNIPREICHYNHELYDFSGAHLLYNIKNCSDTVNHLMVFGHNGAITNVANTYGDKIIDNVPTCGFVSIIFKEDSWRGITQGKTETVIFPKALKT